jgi:hypothetical protein
VTTYPFFYFQLGCSLALGSLCTWAYVRYYPGPLYARWYWPIQFTTTLAGTCVFFDVFDHLLADPRVSKRLLKSMRLLIFSGLGTFICLLFVSDSWRRTRIAIPLERNFRASEAALLIVLMVLLFRSRVAVSKDIKGIILGYGLYVGVSVAFLATLSYYGCTRWAFVQALAYNISLVIWLVSLWRPKTTPAQFAGVGKRASAKIVLSRFMREAQA